MIGIYQILNLVDGKSYVGQSIDVEARWSQHLRKLAKQDHHSILLQRAWNKYSAASFKFNVLQECPEASLDYLEAFWMARLDSVANGYNLCSITLDSGKILHQKSSLTVSKMRAKALLRSSDPEYRKKLSKALIGRSFSDEHRQNIALAQQSRTEEEKAIRNENCRQSALNRSPETKARMKAILSLALRGRSYSDETRKRMSKGQLGRVQSDETKKKIGEANRNCSEETRKKKSESAKLAWLKRKGLAA